MEGSGKTFFRPDRERRRNGCQASTLLKELVSAGAVRVRRDGPIAGGVARLHSSFNGRATDSALGNGDCGCSDDLCATISRAHRKAAGVSKRSAVNQQIPLSAIEEYQRLLDSEGQRFLELIDTWLTARQRTVRSGKGAEPTVAWRRPLPDTRLPHRGDPYEIVDPVSSQTHSPVVSPECRIPAHPPDGSGGTGGNSGFGPSKLPRRRHGHFSGQRGYICERSAYSTSGTSVEIDGAPGLKTQLQLDDVVTVSGTDGNRAITGGCGPGQVSAEMFGTVSTTDVSGGTFLVLGQTVRTDSQHFPVVETRSSRRDPSGTWLRSAD